MVYDYALENIEKIEEEYASDYTRIMHKTKLSKAELTEWKDVADNMYFPFDEERKSIYNKMVF